MQCSVCGVQLGNDQQYRITFLLLSMKMNLCYWLQRYERNDSDPAHLGKERMRLPCFPSNLSPCRVGDVEEIQKFQGKLGIKGSSHFNQTQKYCCISCSPCGKHSGDFQILQGSSLIYPVVRVSSVIRYSEECTLIRPRKSNILYWCTGHGAVFPSDFLLLHWS